MPGLLRRLGLFDAVMLVMGGIVGSGIFINPYVVAEQVHTPFLILGAWAAGGAVALVEPLFMPSSRRGGRRWAGNMRICARRSLPR